MVTEGDHDGGRADDIVRCLDHLLACFGPDRLMFGSHRPVCLIAAGYRRVFDLVEGFVARACPAHRAAVFDGTASRVFGLARRGMVA